MENARSDMSPLDERYSLDDVINGLAADLTALRAGKISVEDARVRGELAKQIMNGVRIVINAQKFLAGQARLLPASSFETPPADAPQDEGEAGCG
jgi:hypothetical protein